MKRGRDTDRNSKEIPKEIKDIVEEWFYTAKYLLRFLDPDVNKTPLSGIFDLTKKDEKLAWALYDAFDVVTSEKQFRELTEHEKNLWYKRCIDCSSSFNDTFYATVFTKKAKYVCRDCKMATLELVDVDHFVPMYKHWYKRVKERAICWMIIGKRLNICRDVRLLIASHIL